MAEPIDTSCPGCGHPMNLHAKEIGCFHGWKHHRSGGVAEEGCTCPLTLAEQHHPAREREIDTWVSDPEPGAAPTAAAET